MKFNCITVAVAISAFFIAFAAVARSTPVSTAITYQGQLKQAGNTMNAAADFQFTLFDAASEGVALGAMLSLNNVNIVNGLFTVELDFGAGMFGGESRWLQIAVRSPAGSGAYTTLSPRQPVHPAPLAQFALNVNGATITGLNASNIAGGTLPNFALSGAYNSPLTFLNGGNIFNGSFSGNGAALTNLNASSLSSGTLNSNVLSGSYTNALTFSSPSNSFAGSGAGLTNLNANNLTSGIVPTGRVAGAYSNLTGVGILTAGSWQASPITAGFGGTGHASYTNGDILYATAALTLGKLPIGPAGRFLKSTGSVPSWGTLAASDFSIPTSISGAAPNLHVFSATNTASNGRYGLAGEIFGGSGLGSGVYGLTNRNTGEGVFGWASSTSGTTYGVHGRSDSSLGSGVFGQALSSGGSAAGVRGESSGGNGYGVYGSATATSGVNYGVFGRTDSTSGTGIFGFANAATGAAYGGQFTSNSSSGTALYAEATATSGTTYGGRFRSQSASGYAVHAVNSANGYAGYFLGNGHFSGNVGIGTTSPQQSLSIAAGMNIDQGGGNNGTSLANGLRFGSFSGEGISSNRISGTNLYGLDFYTNNFRRMMITNIGNVGIGTTASGSNRLHVVQTGASNSALVAESEWDGVVGMTTTTGAYGVLGSHYGSTGKGVVGSASGAGAFGVYASGNMGASGTKSFQIDHPLDPENKYLQHYCAEGPQPFNIYRGNVVLDGAGEAWVELPEYFDAINVDFHYQLTPIGGAAPSLHVAQEIMNNAFRISGGKPGMKISWMVTAVRHDRYMRAHPASDAVVKSDHERGKYVQPELYGQPAAKGILHRPRE